jgi:hypothetical protein
MGWREAALTFATVTTRSFSLVSIGKMGWDAFGMRIHLHVLTLPREMAAFQWSVVSMSLKLIAECMSLKVERNAIGMYKMAQQ